MPPQPTKTPTSAAEDARLRIANMSLVPFAADILSDLTIRPRRTTMIPLNQPHLLTREAVEAVSEIIRRGVIKFLVRQGGWQKRRWVRDEQEQPGEAQRLLEHLSAQGVTLCYTDRAIDAMLCAYNAMAYLGGAREDKKQSGHKLSYSSRAHPDRHNGDLLLHYILGWAMRQTHYHFEPAYTGYFSRNPLAQLGAFDVAEPAAAQGLVALLFGPELEPLTPWLMPHITRTWLACAHNRWQTMGRFESWAAGMGWVMEGFLERAKAHERQDVLIGPMRFYAAHFAREDAESVWSGEFREMTQALRLAERDSLRRTWAKALWPAWRIWEAYRHTRGTAPIDRLGGDTLFMEAIETQGSTRSDYEKVAWRARSFAEHLESVIS